MLVPEPVAAAAHFAAVTGHSPRQATAVYDLGAGTFDVAVVGSGPGGLTVLADAGLPDLGGLDADQALLDHLGRQVAGQDPDGWQRLVDPRSAADRLAAMALRQDVRLAKEALSEHPQTEVMLPAPFGVVLVTRAELENLIEPRLRRSTELLATTARGAALAVGWPGAVYLVGGSSRIPLVARLIAEQFGVVPVALDQPETVVAFGAHLAVPLPPAGHRAEAEMAGRRTGRCAGRGPERTATTCRPSSWTRVISAAGGDLQQLQHERGGPRRGRGRHRRRRQRGGRPQERPDDR